MVAAKLRNLHVSLPSSTCDETERVQEALFYTATEEQYVISFTPSQLYATANRNS